MNRRNNPNIINIVYFSGTGGTALSAKHVSDALKNKDINADISELFQHNNPSIEPYDMLILMFPVYAADAPYPIYKWISSLPIVQNKKAVIISVSGGGEVSPNTDCRIKSLRLLEKKGFQVTNEYMLCMPANFITATVDNLAVKLIQILPRKCDIIANEIVNGIPRRKKAILKDRLIRFLCKPEKIGSKFFGRTIKVNTNCNSCELCLKKCPTSNIKMVNGKPEFQWKCCLCMRCVYSCPSKALKPRFMSFCVLKDGFDLGRIQKKVNQEEIPNADNFSNSLIWNGVTKYITDIEHI